jgi:hypothetical protein
VVVSFEKKTDVLPQSLEYKVGRMPSIDSKSRFESENRKVDCQREHLARDEDLVMEQILDNINSTPIGQVLKKIASLPEVRKEKVLDVRRQITKGEYDLNERLDVAVDKFLEQLTG